MNWDCLDLNFFNLLFFSAEQRRRSWPRQGQSRWGPDEIDKNSRREICRWCQKPSWSLPGYNKTVNTPAAGCSFLLPPRGCFIAQMGTVWQPGLILSGFGIGADVLYVGCMEGLSKQEWFGWAVNDLKNSTLCHLLSQKLNTSDRQIFWCWHDAQITRVPKLHSDLKSTVSFRHYEWFKNWTNFQFFLVCCFLFHTSSERLFLVIAT